MFELPFSPIVPKSPLICSEIEPFRSRAMHWIHFRCRCQLGRAEGRGFFQGPSDCNRLVCAPKVETVSRVCWLQLTRSVEARAVLPISDRISKISCSHYASRCTVTKISSFPVSLPSVLMTSVFLSRKHSSRFLTCSVSVSWISGAIPTIRNEKDWYRTYRRRSLGSTYWLLEHCCE